MMTYFPLTESQRAWQERVAEIARREIGPRAATADRERRYPRESLDALREAGLWGLRASQEHGGLGADLLTTCLIVEEIAKQCPSTAMCYKMHLEASEVLCRVPTPYQIERFVEPLARGEVLATVAGSESHGAGDNWTASPIVSTVERVPGGYQGDGVRKSDVTSAGEATHYFFLCRIGADAAPSAVSLLFVERDAIEWEILERGRASACAATPARRCASAASCRRRTGSARRTPRWPMSAGCSGRSSGRPTRRPTWGSRRAPSRSPVGRATGGSRAAPVAWITRSTSAAWPRCRCRSRRPRRCCTPSPRRSTGASYGRSCRYCRRKCSAPTPPCRSRKS